MQKKTSLEGPKEYKPMLSDHEHVFHFDFPLICHVSCCNGLFTLADTKKTSATATLKTDTKKHW